MSRSVTVTLMTLLLSAAASAQDQPDPYLWLEEVEGERALTWVKEQSARTVAELERVPEFAAVRARNLEIYDSKDRIPEVGIRGRYLYNFWRDSEHVRGVWRRTTLEQYRTAVPAWETVIDVDALATAEHESWVWKGASCLPFEHRHCMVALSRGGGDAVVYREFDTQSGAFVPGGFALPEAKSNVDWKDENTLWVGTDFGPDSLTSSGYPRLAKEWRRGTPLAEARTVFAGEVTDVSSSASSVFTPEGRYDLVYRGTTFFSGSAFLQLGGRLVKLDLPEDANSHGFFKDQLLVSLRSDWTVAAKSYRQDSLLAIDLGRFLAGDRDFAVLFEPSERVSFAGVTRTRDSLLLTTLDNVRSRLYRLRLTADGWKREEIRLPGLGSAAVTTTSDDDDTFMYSYEDYLTPTSLFLVPAGDLARVEKLKSMPAFFDSTGMTVAQYEATSPDGTRVPYFVVMPKGFEANGKNPTLLEGYGGFEVPMVPDYSGVVGSAWVARGGVYVMSNIRGGGEFGPRWHQAALKEKRPRAFEDFIAVAEDLVARKITSPEHLGMLGGSNGGLLVGAVLNLRPDLFKGVVCAVPLLDMRRYHRLLAGASWMAEYGDPDKEDEWAYIKTWSPYHNLKAGVRYPRAFFFTSTRDDRVHPGHARKMVAKMEAMGYPVLYWENTEGGHAGAADNTQRAQMWALVYSYLWMTLR
jgi:prolyl oligopeptidase